MPSYEEFCEQYKLLQERVDDCESRATRTLIRLATEFGKKIGAPKEFVDPITSQKHRYVAAHKDNEDYDENFPDGAARYLVVRHERISLPQDDDGQYVGYVGLTLSHAQDGYPKRNHLVKCRIRVRKEGLDITVADSPAVHVREGDTINNAVATLEDFFEKLLSFDPANDSADQEAIGFIEYGESEPIKT